MEESGMAEGRISFTIEQTMKASSDQIYRAWTAEFDTWFASPGQIRMVPEVGEPYWFEVVHDGNRHPHYGRFLTLESGRLIEQTWVTGSGGTEGAETVVRVDLSPRRSGTSLRLTHGGFADESSADRHAESWPQILIHLDDTLGGSLSLDHGVGRHHQRSTRNSQVDT
jgi:uncharacterized protein YndB with AHSA1/START domain